MINTLELAKLTENEKISWNYTEIYEVGNFVKVKCNSKMVYRYGYNHIEKKMYVIFRSKNRDVYTYSDVPRAIFVLMNLSESKGKFLNAFVKKVYPYEKRIDLPTF